MNIPGPALTGNAADGWTWAVGVSVVVLLLGLGWFLAPLEPGILALQFAATPHAFAAVIHVWGAEHLARYRAHLPVDALLLLAYGWWGYRWVRNRGDAWFARRGRVRALATWSLPMAAVCDAAENGAHWWLTEMPRFGVPLVYAGSAGAAALKWAFILQFLVLLLWAAYAKTSSRT